MYKLSSIWILGGSSLFCIVSGCDSDWYESSGSVDDGPMNVGQCPASPPEPGRPSSFTCDYPAPGCSEDSGIKESFTCDNGWQSDGVNCFDDAGTVD